MGGKIFPYPIFQAITEGHDMVSIPEAKFVNGIFGSWLGTCAPRNLTIRKCGSLLKACWLRFRYG